MPVSTLKQVAIKQQLVFIRIYHKFDGGTEKLVPRITAWHHKACQVVRNGNH